MIGHSIDSVTNSIIKELNRIDPANRMSDLEVSQAKARLTRFFETLEEARKICVPPTLSTPFPTEEEVKGKSKNEKSKQ